jgi:molecular chaperone DnaK
MTRPTTIDFGIDLGTTNSGVCLTTGPDAEVIQNNEHMDITPSAVYIGKDGRLLRGRNAKVAYARDYKNVHFRFKRMMGTDHEYLFPDSGRLMTPEDLSAEVLKSLRENVEKRLKGESLTSAVITVPAAFELPQCNATKRAAELAGIRNCILLTEPVAAAIAYGFQSLETRATWLVHDIGGGTFDAAVVQVRDGLIRIVNHGGDNFLGGEDIDWAIVDKILAPAVARQYRVRDFVRANKEEWGQAFAKLKFYAEQAKIRLSAEEEVVEVIENLFSRCPGFAGEAVDYELELARAEIEPLIEPVVARCINICRRVLAEKRVGMDSISKVILVGGPTLTPYLRERLADPKDGLGPQLEFAKNPLTVVARGAAIFAGGQRDDAAATPNVPRGRYAIEFSEYEPVGPESDFVVSGRIVGDGSDKFSGLTIEFLNPGSSPAWRSGRVPLGPNGTFRSNLMADRGRLNTYEIDLRDAKGSRLVTMPEHLTYTVGIVYDEVTLTHDVGVVLFDNSVEIMFRKGEALPARSRTTLHTTVSVRRGEADRAKIPIVEGESRWGDGNREVMAIKIKGADINRDLPLHSEIQFTMDIDKSRLVKCVAWVALLDKEFREEFALMGQSFDGGVELVSRKPGYDQLKSQAERERRRLGDLEHEAGQIQNAGANTLLSLIREEQTDDNLERSLAASVSDATELVKCEKDLRTLRDRLNDVEAAIEWQRLKAEASEWIPKVRALVEDRGTPGETADLDVLEREVTDAFAGPEDPVLLRKRTQKISSFYYRIRRRDMDFWIGGLQYCEGARETMAEQRLAAGLFDQGNAAVRSGDILALSAAVGQLISLLPDGEAEASKAYGSTVVSEKHRKYLEDPGGPGC